MTPCTILAASPPSVWATPDLLDRSEKVHSFEDPAVGEPNGELKEAETPKEPADSKAEVVTNGSDFSGSPKKTLDMESPLSFASNMAVPPNTPQIIVGDVSIVSPEEVDVTVYEKTPYGVMPTAELSRNSSGVKIVSTIERVAQTVIGEQEKGSSITYIAHEESPVLEEPVKTVDVVNVTATPFIPDATAAVRNAVDAVDGPTESADGQSHSDEATVNGKSQVVINGFGDDEGLVSEGPDCDDLLGSFLVRPCPSMRPFRRMFAKGFLVVLLLVIVAFIVAMVLINRS